MTILTSLRLAAVVALSAAFAFAGPPLICHKIDTGGAQSLPWRDSGGWNGADPAYQVANLIDDTLKLLHPSQPLKARMETMRRAAIYTAKDAALADRLLLRLAARALDNESRGHKSPDAWFDAGYFAETLRQAAFIYRHDMLSAAEKANWKLRGSGPALDGLPWVEKAVQLGMKDAQPAIAWIVEYRNSDVRVKSAGLD